MKKRVTQPTSKLRSLPRPPRLFRRLLQEIRLQNEHQCRYAPPLPSYEQVALEDVLRLPQGSLASWKYRVCYLCTTAGVIEHANYSQLQISMRSVSELQPLTPRRHALNDIMAYLLEELTDLRCDPDAQSVAFDYMMRHGKQLFVTRTSAARNTTALPAVLSKMLNDSATFPLMSRQISKVCEEIQLTSAYSSGNSTSNPQLLYAENETAIGDNNGCLRQHVLIRVNLDALSQRLLKKRVATIELSSSFERNLIATSTA